MSRKDQFDRYIDLTLQVRALSSPLISDIENEKGYRDTLLDNFRHIGEYAREKNQIMQEAIQPLLDSKRLLKKGEIEDLKYLYARIFNAYRMENLDIPLTFRIADRILYDADKKGNEKDIIAALDAKVEISFTYMHMVQRLVPVDGTCYHIRDEGLKAAERLLTYLPKAKFRQLPDDISKELVLINARYISSLFDRSDHFNQKSNRQDLKTLEKALALTYDPFYTREAPNYNWHYHEFRTLQYITDLVQFGNIRGFDKEGLEKIYHYTKQLKKLWYSNETYFSRHMPSQMVDLYLNRIARLTGRQSERRYRADLYQIIQSGEAMRFDFHENLINVFAMSEYLLAISDSQISPEERKQLKLLYDRIAAYVHRMPKKGSVSFMLSFLADVLKLYQEVQVKEEYEDFCLKIMAALHPLTYVHSLSVAELATLLTKALLRRQPERFIGFHGYQSREEVLQNKKDILHFAYHSALTHDIGKLFVAEIITTYDRKLFAEELRMIQSHPLIGAFILSKHEETREYASIACYHHLYYDGSQGYPRADIAELPERPFIDILACADCLDAATDAVGRSYKEGKTLQQFVDELKEGRGTRYAPYVVDLLEEEKVLAEIRKKLESGRDQNYQKTYHLLSS